MAMSPKDTGGTEKGTGYHPPMLPQETRESIRQSAKKYAEAQVYTLNNSYTTKEEKLEIEVWYQTPIVITGYVFTVACFFWSRGWISGWHAFLITAAAGVIVPTSMWLAYRPGLFFALFMVLDIPVLNWAIPLAVAAWIIFSGHWLEGSLLAVNTALLKLPTGVVPIVANQFLTCRSGMNPKYGLLKCKHGKLYPFE
jgi:hypothetical protein